MKISVLTEMKYPLLPGNFLEVETDNITSYNVKMTSIRMIDDKTCKIINNNSFKLAEGFSNEEEALEWLKEQGIQMKLLPVCAISFVYNYKEYTAIYVPEMDKSENKTINMNELVIGKPITNCSDRKYIRINTIYPAVGKSFLNMIIEAGYTTKESIDNMFIYETSGFGGDNSMGYTIKIPIYDNRLDSTINQKIVINEHDVCESKLQCKNILYIDLNDRMKLTEEISKWNTFEMTQKEIIDAISNLDYVKEIVLEKISLRTQPYYIEHMAYKPIGDESGIYWIYLSNDEIRYEAIKPYDTRFIDMKQMYKTLNKGECK